MTKVRKEKVASNLLVRIIGDGAMAGPVVDGKLIPVLLIDIEDRPDIQELIRHHQYLASGEARTQWATLRTDEDIVMLRLTFLRPSEVDLVLLFSIERQGILVESMIRCGAVYLQGGSLGDRLPHLMSRECLWSCPTQDSVRAGNRCMKSE